MIEEDELPEVTQKSRFEEYLDEMIENNDKFFDFQN